MGNDQKEPVMIEIAVALQLLELAYDNLEFEDAEDDRRAHGAALEHLSKTCRNPEQHAKVWLLTARDRNVARYREEGRFSNAPDTKQQADTARTYAEDAPVLMLMRQNGESGKGVA